MITLFYDKPVKCLTVGKRSYLYWLFAVTNPQIRIFTHKSVIDFGRYFSKHCLDEQKCVYGKISHATVICRILIDFFFLKNENILQVGSKPEFSFYFERC
jgi:hypothetical protein